MVHDASCRFGALVAKLNTVGFDASRSDVDGESIRVARERGNLKIHQCHFSKMIDLIPHGAEIITCYHSVEHYYRPAYLFPHSEALPSSVWIFPDGGSQRRVPASRLDYVKKFDWCFYPGHLQYFTPYSATVLLAKAGLRVTETF